jgi:hypothetical protein
VDALKEANLEVETKTKKSGKVKVKSIRPRRKISREKSYTYIFNKNDLAELKKIALKIPSKYNTFYTEWILATFSFVDLYYNVDDISFQKEIYETWDNWCKQNQGGNYNEVNNKKIFESMKLDYIDANYIAYLTNTRYRFKKIVKQSYLDSKFDKYKVTMNDCNYRIHDDVFENFKSNTVTFIKSPCGSGKTYLIGKIKEYWGNKSIISIIIPINYLLLLEVYQKHMKIVIKMD